MHSTWAKTVLTIAGAAAIAAGVLGAQGVLAAPTDNAEVILMYHDFYGPSSIWINKSTDGGATFGAPENVVANFTTTNPLMDTIVADDMACNTVPSGVKIVKSGPHAGRIYLAWIAADAAQNTSGCNITMTQSFHNLIVAWSDDNGATWTPQVAMDIGIGQDASTPFAAFTIDDQGNPYFAFDSQTPQPPSSGPSTRATTCATESATGTAPVTDTKCDYHMYVIWSPDGGTTWDDGGGSPAGSASIAYQADPAGQNGTDQFATIAAGDPGKVDISYLHTNAIEPQDPYGKFDPLGCDGGDNATNTDPLPTYPPRCDWNLYVGQSVDLASTTKNPSQAVWTNAVASPVMHYGDICNLGIACAQQAPPAVPRDPRHLLDFNMETLDPTTGCAHVVFADDNAGSVYGDPSHPDATNGGFIVAANQTSGQNVLGLTGTCSGTTAPAYTLNHLPQYGGEPSVTADGTGELYATSPNLGLQVDLSADKGVTWTKAPTNPDTSSGDNCLATDQSNALYACNLAGSTDTCELQADVWKTVNHGATWEYGNNTTIPMPSGTTCGTSTNPFGVDRDWVDAWIPGSAAPNGVPETPSIVLLLPVAAVAAGMTVALRRRRRSSPAA